jgi:hypothetical protein
MCLLVLESKSGDEYIDVKLGMWLTVVEASGKGYDRNSPCHSLF